MSNLSSLELAKLAVKALDSKKGEKITLLDIQKLTTIGEYFLIASAPSTTQVKALADEVDEILSKNGAEPKRVEGYQSATWILMDYDGLIVHVYQTEAREFYSLERLWADAPAVDISDLVTEN